MPSVIAAANKYPGTSEILFVDDASTDTSLEIAAKEFPELTIIARPVNGGFSATCNSGIEKATGDVVFFLNTDVELTENFFSSFSKFFDNEDTFAVTVRAYHYDTKQPLDAIKKPRWKRGNLRVTENIFLDSAEPSKWYRSFCVQGAYFFADRKKLNELEGFDELFSPYIFEETDLSYRALQRGWKIYYDHDAVAYHQHNITIASTAKAETVRKISIRNRLIFTWKNIQSVPLLLSHFFFLFVKLVTGNVIYWKATTEAWSKLPAILEKRRTLKRHRICSDKELIQEFQSS